MTPSVSYLVCATGRSGSNLLCGLLRGRGSPAGRRSTSVAGTIPRWARRWGASGPVEYVHGAIREGTRNGVFGAKVMWFHMPNLLAKLEAVQGRIVEERALLEGTFPGLRFVWIRRDDVVAQAVSYAKADADGRVDGAGPAPSRSGRALRLRADRPARE